jgi:hypothetical protein
MMFEEEHKFSRDEIIDLLKRLDQYLLKIGKNETVYIVGGAAMSLSFDKDRTSDIDSNYDSSSSVQQAVDIITNELGLSKTWFNNSVNQILAYFSPDDDKKTIYIGNNLTVEFASEQYVLAMKLAARREKDIADVRILIDALGIKSKSEIIDIAMKYFKADLSNGSYQRDSIEEFLDVVWEEWR